MGDEFSDWEGVYYDFSTCDYVDPDAADADKVCKEGKLGSALCVKNDAGDACVNDIS